LATACGQPDHARGRTEIAELAEEAVTGLALLAMRPVHLDVALVQFPEQAGPSLAVLADILGVRIEHNDQWPAIPGHQRFQQRRQRPRLARAHRQPGAQDRASARLVQGQQHLFRVRLDSQP
jgi:hypothetical protein